MSGLREQIYDRMNQKENGELLEIWQTNDRVEWSEDAFEVVKEILQRRGVEIPAQDEPIYEHKQEEQQGEDYDFSPEELKIIDDETTPDFYDPFDVLLTVKRIDWMAKAVVAFNILYNIFQFPSTQGIVQSYFIRNPDSIFVYILALLLAGLNIVLGTVVIYFSLKTLAHILRILMEMEFRSRKV
jgi:hypothetical protein